MAMRLYIVSYRTTIPKTFILTPRYWFQRYNQSNDMADTERKIESLQQSFSRNSASHSSVQGKTPAVTFVQMHLPEETRGPPVHEAAYMGMHLLQRVDFLPVRFFQLGS
jgi:hypothetical protein